MVRSRTPSQCDGSMTFEMQRKYSVPSNPESRAFSGTTSEDLHAWSIYRQNLNSDFTDNALGSQDKSPLPYGNFQLRDTTVQSILSHPRYGPKSALGSNMYTYLKFGLPRVFPPNHDPNRSGTPQHFIRNSSTRPREKSSKSGHRIPRDGSSGYDSSDNETANQYKQNRKYRSDPDFRMHNVNMTYQHETGIPLAALKQHGVSQPPPSQFNRNKSISEANLLMTEYSKGGYNPQMRDPRRNSVADFGMRDYVDHGTVGNMNRPFPKPESHLSYATRKSQPMAPRPEFLPSDDESRTVFLYPHLQVLGLSVCPERTSCCGGSHYLLLNDISFEVRGGEMLALISTSEEESTTLLDILAGRRDALAGDIILNGQRVRSNALKSRVAYVQNDLNLCEDMTVAQTLRFHYDLKKPTDKLGYFKLDAMDRINVLIEDLGLEQVRHTKVASMTVSEKRRLNVACQLLLDTDIVLFDQPTKGMDIFDTFFLVEYLRQWASGGTSNALGKIVILTLHPPTYEIFTMLSRILLLSAGRIMFSGRRRDMLPYFASVDYPCPSFKNPSDYYLDLVTLDDLSAEAMLESSQRIEQLAEIFRQKQEPLSDPGPPSSLPSTVKSSNFLVQASVLFTKSLVYTQTNTFLYWLTLLVASASLSLIVGAIFWDVPKTDYNLSLNDRPGYHYAVMCLMCWPLLLQLTYSEIRRNRKVVERDIRHGLYGRFTYIFFKTVFNIFPSLFIWIIYLVPSYSMSGLYMQSPNDYDGFYVYLGVMLLYLSCVQIFLTAFIYLFAASNASVFFASMVMTLLFSSSGYFIHFNDLPVYIKYLKFASPTEWLLPFLLNRELTPTALATVLSSPPLCRNKQIQHQDIIVQLPCPVPNGTQILHNYGFLDSQKEVINYENTPLALTIFYIACFVLTIFAFVVNFGSSKKNKQRNGNSY
ncbi:ATP-binding cassette sub-family G member 8 [Harmonia axyridis]|uniref:ATP-binding cassette sub-family G member 8 n=1 Tax=Harmonia axyridis TaxID=115357 RepID=UPI001E2785D1|nr:ATP-binding cassette sub-family G member 8 [Harmonia axyridis]